MRKNGVLVDAEGKSQKNSDGVRGKPKKAGVRELYQLYQLYQLLRIYYREYSLYIKNP